VSANNFREDLTVNGAINSSDIALAQSQSGTALPVTEPETATAQPSKVTPLNVQADDDPKKAQRKAASSCLSSASF
jgi:hypothetical protein